MTFDGLQLLINRLMCSDVTVKQNLQSELRIVEAKIMSLLDGHPNEYDIDRAMTLMYSYSFEAGDVTKGVYILLLMMMCCLSSPCRVEIFVGKIYVHTAVGAHMHRDQ